MKKGSPQGGPFFIAAPAPGGAARHGEPVRHRGSDKKTALKFRAVPLSYQDSNLEFQNQNLTCYHYTIAQAIARKLGKDTKFSAFPNPAAKKHRQKARRPALPATRRPYEKVPDQPTDRPERIRLRTPAARPKSGTVFAFPPAGPAGRAVCENETDHSKNKRKA